MARPSASSHQGIGFGSRRLARTGVRTIDLPAQERARHIPLPQPMQQVRASKIYRSTKIRVPELDSVIVIERFPLGRSR